MFRAVAFRLTAYNVGVILIILALSGVATYFAVFFALQRSVDEDLVRAAGQLQRSDEFLGQYPTNASLMGVPLQFVRSEREEDDEEDEHPVAVPFSTTVTVPAYFYDANGKRVLEINTSEIHDGLPNTAQKGVDKALRNTTDVRTVISSDHPVRLLSVPVVDGGVLVGVVQLAKDIEEQKNLLGALRLGLLAVGAVAAFVTLGGGYILARRALQPIQTAFENQALFIAHASHQLRTPIAVIRADAEVLERSVTNLTEEDQQILQDMIHSSDLLSRLVQQLITAAQLEEQRTPNVREHVQVAEMIEDIHNIVLPLARERGIDIVVEKVPRDISVTGDATQIKLALMGLVDNAIKYNSAGGSVRLSATTDGTWVEVIVSDTGHGISGNEQGRAFERFFRGANADASEVRGSGLGLPIARQVALAHGGDLTLTSTLGSGTTVVMQLPI